jgi:hypothetical protein
MYSIVQDAIKRDIQFVSICSGFVEIGDIFDHSIDPITPRLYNFFLGKRRHCVAGNQQSEQNSR